MSGAPGDTARPAARPPVGDALHAALGPALLGRGAVVASGRPTPAPLDGADRVRVDAAVVADPGRAVDLLHDRWVRRRPVVVELAVDPADLRRPERWDAPVHAHDPTALPALERLRHLVWANGVDLRGDRPTWWHAVKAARALPGVQVGGTADVVLPDGRPAWVDGGPRQPVDLDEVVLHRDDAERGVLAPQRRRRPAAGEERLAADQAAAVHAALGAVRVAAPAGSGKTRVLTARLRELLVGRGVPADAVLALAYNTRAAAEMRRRTQVPGVRVATVHAYALEVLTRHVGPLAVLGEREVRGVLGGLVDVPRRANADPLQPWLDALERVRTALVDPAVVAAEVPEVEGLVDVLPAYRAALARRGAVDFPEMVYRALELLLGDPAAREAEQARVGLVLVDEFQDLTPAYLLLVRLLASPQLQCTGVGDDDQVIYGHAGADPRFLIGFDRLFPGAEDHPLTTNHRCPAPVVAAADRLLRHNAVRIPKRIAAGPGALDVPIAVHEVPTAEQAATAGAVVAAALREGAEPADVAVLARVRVALLGTQADLAARGIACRSPVGDWLLARTGVRAALAYLRLAVADRMAGEDLAEVLHRPLRPIPATLKDVLRARDWDPDELRDRLVAAAPGRAGAAVTRFARELDALRGRAAHQPTAELLRHVADGIGLGDAAASLDDSGGPQIGASHLDDLDALVQVADHCPQPAAFESFLARVVRQPAPDGPAVTLSTIHAVKGLEWPHVVVVGCAEGVLPHRLARTPAAVEEERRVFHVAMTRASRRLVLVAPTTGTSRFVAESLGRPSPLAPATAARPSVGAARTAAPGRRRPAAAGRTGPPRFRAAAGLQLAAAGGLAGTVEQVTDDAALVRTARGALLRLRFGSEVRVDGAVGTLVSP
jgi:DNA helicase II / ATP-dependent DNA helicase PcrA